MGETFLVHRVALLSWSRNIRRAIRMISQRYKPRQRALQRPAPRAHHGGEMRRTRRLLLAGGLALGARVAAAAVRPRMAEIRRSFRTSSSPGAAAYDVIAGLFLGGYYDDIAADCAATLDVVASPSVLEIGPGPGHLAVRLLALLPDGHWTGLDIDRAMLDAAERRLADEGLAARSTAVEGDVTVLPFDDAAFDLVVSSLSAHHWPDATAAFREIRRVLRSGAVALVFDLPETWGHVETGFGGLGAATAVFEAPRVSRMRGLGSWTLIRRVELSRPADD
jgi:ubiquinone/menaquinone biosynthesis C-methylase UbiE